MRSLLTVPGGYLILPSRFSGCAAVLRLRLVRLVRARAIAIVEDAITEDGNRGWRKSRRVVYLDVSCDPALTRVKLWVVTQLRFRVSQRLI